MSQLTPKPPHYRAYLLRLWVERRDEAEASVVWRFSLEDPHRGERKGFSSFETLMAFLQEVMASSQAEELDGPC